MSAIYTRTGDSGETGLFGGTRVAKQSPRVEAYGAVDEASAALGHAKSLMPNGAWRDSIHRIQKRLFVLAAELASDARGAATLDACIDHRDIADLESLIDSCLAVAGPQTSFVVPGRDTRSAVLHEARTVVRRAERRALAAAESEPVRPELLKFLNRLSDAVYALARVAESWADADRVAAIVRRAVEEHLDFPIERGGTGLIERGGTGLGTALERAHTLTAAARERALEIGVPMAIAVVDGQGHLVSFERMENTLLASSELAINKAWSAVAFKQSTAELGGQAAKMMPGVEATNQGRVVLFGGGIPFQVEGRLAGAIGISGGTVDEDCDVANHALAQVKHIHQTGDSQ